MQTGNKIALGIIVVFGIATSIAVKRNQGHVAPEFLYPDPEYTTGVVLTTSYDDLTKDYGGKTYSASHRNVPESEKKEVLQEYGNPTGVLEIDHFCAVALGCSNDKKNLWAQREHVMWDGQDFGFRTKDKLETFLVNAMKSKKISPEAAQQCLIRDWVACFQNYSTEMKVTGIQKDEDNELETITN